MILNIRTYLDYEIAAPSDILLQFEVAARADQRILSAHIDVRTPEYPLLARSDFSPCSIVSDECICEDDELSHDGG